MRYAIVLVGLLAVPIGAHAQSACFDVVSGQIGGIITEAQLVLVNHCTGETWQLRQVPQPDASGKLTLEGYAWAPLPKTKEPLFAPIPPPPARTRP